MNGSQEGLQAYAWDACNMGLVMRALESEAWGCRMALCPVSWAGLDLLTEGLLGAVGVERYASRKQRMLNGDTAE